MKFYRVLSLLLCISLLAVCPVAVSADYSEDAPYVPDLSVPGTTLDRWTLTNFQVTGDSMLASTNNDGKAIYDGDFWSGQYTVQFTTKADWNNDSNMVNIYFNYQKGADDKETYYRLSIGGATDSPTSTSKVSLHLKSGEAEIPLLNEEVRIPHIRSFTQFTLNYDDGNISLRSEKSPDEDIIAVRDTTLQEGKIGFGSTSFNGAPFKDIKVWGDSLLRAPMQLLSNSMEDGSTEVELQPTITLQFNTPVKESTLTTDNLTVYIGEYTGNSNADKKASGYELELDKGDRSIVHITFPTPLAEKTKYTVVVSKNLLALINDEGLNEQYKFQFTTKSPDFEVVSKTVKDASGADITDALSSKAGTEAVLSIEMNNKYLPGDKAYSAVVLIRNTDGKAAYSVPVEGIVGMNSVETVEIPFVVPAGIESGYTIDLVFVDSFDTMKPEGSTLPPVTFKEKDFVGYTIDVNNNMIIVGELPNGLADRNVTLLVTSPETELEDFLAGDVPLQQFATTVTLKDGLFGFPQFPVTFTEDCKEGTFKIYLGGDDFSELTEVATFYLSAPELRRDAMVQINQATETQAMVDALKANKDILMYNIPALEALDASGHLAAVADKIIARVAEKPFMFPDDQIEIGEFISRCLLVEAFNQSEEDAVTNEDGTIYGADVLGLPDLDYVQEEEDKEPVQEFTFYETYVGLSRSGLQGVVDGLMGQNFESAEELQELFKELAVVYGVTSYDQDGYGHVRDLLEINADEIGLDLSEYDKLRTSAKKDKVDRKLISEELESLDELQKKLDKLSKDERESSSNNGGGSGGGGGGSRPSGGTSGSSTIVGDLGQNQQPTINPKPNTTYELKDMAGCEWAIESVMKLIDHRVIFEPADGNFRPNDNITRAEFTKMIVLAQQKLTASAKETGFVDCPSDHWAAMYVASAKAAGYVNGISETEFGVDMPITRQDVAVIMSRALGKMAPEPAEGEELPEVTFTDMDQIADYAKDAVTDLVLGSVINGMGDGRFAPEEYCTRAQAAKLIASIFTN